jgi:hypothetical protein
LGFAGFNSIYILNDFYLKQADLEEISVDLKILLQPLGIISADERSNSDGSSEIGDSEMKVVIDR